MNHELITTHVPVAYGASGFGLPARESQVFAPRPGAPAISLRMLRPFLLALSAQPGKLDGPLGRLPLDRPDERVALEEVLPWLDEPGLGLWALGLVDHGSFDILELLAGCASSWGQALVTLGNYAPLLCDGFAFVTTEHENEIRVELRCEVPLHRLATEYALGLIALAARAWLGSLSDLGFCFAHAAPRDLEKHRAIFGTANLRFNAPANAFTFSKQLASAPLRRSDRHLHAVLRRYADELLPAPHDAGRLTSRVEKLVLELLPSGKGAIRYVAAKLGMSRRTVTRHLSREGVRYKDLVEKARCRLAYQHLASPGYEVKQIAHMLGYSETAAFSRAFRRWSGKSPLAYRRAQQQIAEGKVVARA